MSVNRGVDKKDVVYMDYGPVFSHKKKNEIMTFAATEMDLEIIIPREVSHTEKNK